MLEGDERADLHFGQSFRRLDDDFDILPRIAGRSEQRQVPHFRQHPAQFRLENHQHGDRKSGQEFCQQPEQHPQLQRRGDNPKHQQQRQKTQDHRPAARAPHKHQSVVNPHREDGDFQRGRGLPDFLQVFQDDHFLRARTASAILTAWSVSATSYVRISRTPALTARHAQASAAG